MMNEGDAKIRVAIIGSSFAGALLFRGLSRCPHIQADLFEARPNFRDDGPAITLSKAAEAALREVDPTIDDDFLRRCGAVESRTHLSIAAGPQAGAAVPLNNDSDNDDEALWPVSGTRKTLGREVFFRELLRGMDPRHMHANRRIVSIDDVAGGGEILLSFSDGRHCVFDLVVGADGIHGASRRHILDAADPLLRPRPSGYWGLHLRVPTERARQFMGPEFLDVANPWSGVYIGEGTSMSYELFDEGREVLLYLCGRDPPRSEAEQDDDDDDYDGGLSWAKLLTADELEDVFSASVVEPCPGIVKLAQSVYTVQMAATLQMIHAPQCTYTPTTSTTGGPAPAAAVGGQGTRGGLTSPAVLLGEAAHAQTSPPNEILLSSLESALLTTLLITAVTTSPPPSTSAPSSMSSSDRPAAHLPSALRAFDASARHRAEARLALDQERREVLHGGRGLDPTSVAAELEQRLAAVPFGVREAVEEAVGILQSGSV